MKRMFSLILAMTLVLGIFGSVSVTAESSSFAFATKSFGYFDEDGTAVTSLEGLSTVVVKAKLENLGADNTEAVIIAAVYNGGEMVDCKTDKRTYKYIGSVQTYELTLELPAVQTDCTIKTYLWDGFATLTPLTDPTTNTTDNANIQSLYINGKKVPDFNASTTELTLNMTTAQLGENPDILAVCEDLGAYVTYSYANGTITLTATASNGTTKTYTVTVPVATDEPTILYSALNYDYTDSTGTNRVTDTNYFTIQPRKLARPDYEKDADGNVLYAPNNAGDTYYVKNSTRAKLNGKANFLLQGDGGKYVVFADVPPQLEGATVLQGRRFSNETDNATYDYSDMTAMLTLNHSATLYYPASKVLNGGTLSTDAGYLRIVELSSETARVPQLNKLTSSKPDNNDSWYELDLVVPEGETKTFTVQVCGATTGASGWKQYGPTLLLKWKDKGTVSNPTLTYTAASDSTMKTVKYTVNSRRLNAPNYNRTAVPVDDTTSTDKKEAIAAFSDWNDIAAKAKATTVYAEKDLYSYVSAVPEALKDGIFLSPGRLSQNPADYENMTASLTINKSAKLYFRATESVAAKTAGATRSKDTVGLRVKQNKYGSTLAADTKVPGTTSWFNSDYESWYEVELNTPEGTEKTFEIPVGGTNSQWGSTHYGPVLILKWQEYQEQDLTVSDLSGTYYDSGSAAWKPMASTVTVSPTGNVKDIVLKTDTDGNTIAYGNDLWNYVTRLNLDAEQGIDIYEDVPDEMVGARAINMKRNDDLYGTGSAKPVKYTFTLDKTATLYFTATPEIAKAMGAEKLDEKIKIRKLNYWANATAWAPGVNDSKAGVNSAMYYDVYKLKCVVPEGQASKTFEVEVGYERYFGTIVSIK